MTAHDKARHEARTRTVSVIQAEVYSDDGLTLKLRAPVYCSRAIYGDRKHRGWDGSVRTAA